MAYSNTTLPQMPGYDTAAYPYAVASFGYGKGEEDWYQIILAVSASAFKASFRSMEGIDGNILKSGMAAVNTGTVQRWIYGEDGVWEEQESGDIIGLPGLAGNVYQRVWTNHDILDESGNVWLAADSVTLVEVSVSDVWLRSFQSGLALGLTGKPLPFKRELVAYLYNGVRLPKVPIEHNGKQYSYASIYGLTDNPTLIVSTSKWWADKEQDGSAWLAYFHSVEDAYSETPAAVMLALSGDGTHWEDINQSYVGNAAVIMMGFRIKDITDVWFNHDVYDSPTGGNLYLAASEPVPIYE